MNKIRECYPDGDNCIGCFGPKAPFMHCGKMGTRAALSATVASDARELARKLREHVPFEDMKEYNQLTLTLDEAAAEIERFVAERERKAREEVDALRMTADRRDYALRLYGTQFEEVFQLAHRRPVPSSLASMLCNMTERHSCEMAKAFTQDEIARRMATRAAFNKEAGK